MNLKKLESYNGIWFKNQGDQTMKTRKAETPLQYAVEHQPELCWIASCQHSVAHKLGGICWGIACKIDGIETCQIHLREGTNA